MLAAKAKAYLLRGAAADGEKGGGQYEKWPSWANWAEENLPLLLKAAGRSSSQSQTLRRWSVSQGSGTCSSSGGLRGGGGGCGRVVDDDDARLFCGRRVARLPAGGSRVFGKNLLDAGQN